MTSSRTVKGGGGVYRVSVGMRSADLLMLRRRGPIGERGECTAAKGTLHDSSGSHKSWQINM